MIILTSEHTLCGHVTLWLVPPCFTPSRETFGEILVDKGESNRVANESPKDFGHLVVVSFATPLGRSHPREAHGSLTETSIAT